MVSVVRKAVRCKTGLCRRSHSTSNKPNADRWPLYEPPFGLLEGQPFLRYSDWQYSSITASLRLELTTLPKAEANKCNWTEHNYSVQLRCYNALGAKNNALATTFSEPSQIFLNSKLSAKPMTRPCPIGSTTKADLLGYTA